MPSYLDDNGQPRYGTPLHRLYEHTGENAGATATVYAGDLADVCGSCDVATFAELTDGKEPTARVTVKTADLRRLVDSAKRQRHERQRESEPRKLKEEHRMGGAPRFDMQETEEPEKEPEPVVERRQIGPESTHAREPFDLEDRPTAPRPELEVKPAKAEAEPKNQPKPQAKPKV